MPRASEFPEIDMSDAGIVRVGSAHVRLGPVEWAMMQLLSGRNIVSKAAISCRVYGERGATDTLISVHLCNLRKKLRGSGIAIRNRAGFGWFLVPEPSDAP